MGSPPPSWPILVPDMWPLFRALADIPTMVLRGAESDILSPTCFAEMQKLKTDLFAVEIPHAGHVPTLAEPEAIGALDNFLAHH